MLYLVLFYWFKIAGRSLFPTPTTLFGGWQLLSFIGTIVIVYGDGIDIGGAGVLRFLQMTIGLTTFVAGAAVANIYTKFSPVTAIRQFLKRPIIDDFHPRVYLFVVLGLGLVSIIVSYLFVSRLGSSPVLSGISSLLESADLRGTAMEYAVGRRSIRAAGEGYLTLGYASQFFSVILPVVIYLIYARMIVKPDNKNRLLLAILIILNIYFFTVAGIRTFFLNFGLTFVLLASSRWGPLGEASRPNLWVWIVIGAVGILYFTTTLIGRAAGYDVVNSFLIPFIELPERIFLVASRNQVAALEIFRHQPILWGEGWMQSLTALLPGSMEGGIGAELARLIHDNPGGSSPPDFWTSTWWNFGWFGIVFVPLVLGYLLQRYAIFFFRSPKRLSRIVVLYASFFVFREVTEPLSLFNRGLATILGIYVIITVAQNLIESKRKLRISADAILESPGRQSL
jgi:hypothetical protein